MTPFEAHILIQQNNPGSNNTLRESLKSKELDPSTTFRNETLLATAIKRNATNLLRLLLEHSANPDLKSYENGRYEPAIITAVRMKSLESVKVLVEHGANIYKTNFYGSDAIFQAVHENAFQILDYLLEEYAPRRGYYQYQSPLHYASTRPLDSGNFIVLERAATSKETTCSHETERRRSRSPTTTSRDKEYGGNCNDDDGDHVLCPFYYALSQALAYSCKRESLLRLLQSYYRCKCFREIGSCCENSGGSQQLSESPPELEAGERRPYHNISHSIPCGEWSGDKTAVRECLAWLQSSSSPSSLSAPLKSGGGGAITRNPAAHNPPLHGGINTSSTATGSASAARGGRSSNGIGIELELDRRGGSGNEQSDMYPCKIYKIYKIDGKCHAIKENESSSSGAGRGRGLSSSYVVLVGPLKLSCITREVIRDQIMLCSAPISKSCSLGTPTQRTSKASTSTPGNKSLVPERQQLPLPRTPTDPATSGSQLPARPTSISCAVASGATNNSLKVKKVRPFSSPSPAIRAEKERRAGNGNFRKSLETLMIPSPLKDYILYRNLNSGKAPNSIQLIKKDLDESISYFAIYIY